MSRLMSSSEQSSDELPSSCRSEIAGGTEEEDDDDVEDDDDTDLDEDTEGEPDFLTAIESLFVGSLISKGYE